MKTTLHDVRTLLVAQLEALSPDAENVPDDIIERAKASALVAKQFIAAVKAEVDARRLYADYSIGVMGEVAAVPRLTMERRP